MEGKISCNKPCYKCNVLFLFCFCSFCTEVQGDTQTGH